MTEDQTYVPMSDKVLRKLDQLVTRTGYSEDQILSMALTKMLASLREVDNDNTAQPSVAMIGN